MQKNRIPMAFRQIVYLAVTIVLPLAFAAVMVAIAPPKPGQTATDNIVALSIVGTVAIGLAAMFMLALMRRSVDMTADMLTVKHSLYTLRVGRADFVSMDVRQISSLDQLGLSTRNNGIAAFGYLSGWFSDIHGGVIFCAVSEKPIYLVTFEGQLKCRQLVLSANPDVVVRLKEWSSQAS